LKRNITIVTKTIEEVEEHKRSVKKPVSPHVTIYKFPLPAWTSITHRFTGVGLTLGTYGIGLATLWGSPHTIEYALESIKYGAPAVVPLLKFLIAFPLVYHGVSGCRHIFWDYTASGIDTKTVEQTSMYMLGVVGVLSLGFTFYTI